MRCRLPLQMYACNGMVGRGYGSFMIGEQGCGNRFISNNAADACSCSINGPHQAACLTGGCFSMSSQKAIPTAISCWCGLLMEFPRVPFSGALDVSLIRERSTRSYCRTDTTVRTDGVVILLLTILLFVTKAGELSNRIQPNNGSLPYVSYSITHKRCSIHNYFIAIDHQWKRVLTSRGDMTQPSDAIGDRRQGRETNCTTAPGSHRTHESSEIFNDVHAQSHRPQISIRTHTQQ